MLWDSMEKKESPTSFLIWVCIPKVEFPQNDQLFGFFMVVPDVQNEHLKLDMAQVASFPAEDHLLGCR
jgi:hypothetical protein